MRRTDSEMLAYVLPLIGGTDTDLTFVERARNLTGALTAGLRGREAIEAAMGAIVLEKGEALPEPTALELIAMECERVRNVEGYTAEHDDEHTRGELARAAASYAIPEDYRHYFHEGTDAPAPTYWPWDARWCRSTPNDRVRELVKAGQLIVAEIERLKRNPVRAEPSPQEELALDRDACNGKAGNSDDCPGCPVCEREVFTHWTKDGSGWQPSKGDRVRVVRSAEDWEGWVPAMSKLIGNTYIVEGVVQQIRQHQATVLVGDWHIPASCVELVP